MSCSTESDRFGRRLRARNDVYALRAGKDAVGEENIPALLALVNTQDDAGLSGWVVRRRVKEQKARTQLSDWNGLAVENQVDPDLGGMTALAA